MATLPLSRGSPNHRPWSFTQSWFLGCSQYLTDLPRGKYQIKSAALSGFHSPPGIHSSVGYEPHSNLWCFVPLLCQRWSTRVDCPVIKAVHSESGLWPCLGQTLVTYSKCWIRGLSPLFPTWSQHFSAFSRASRASNNIFCSAPGV